MEKKMQQVFFMLKWFCKGSIRLRCFLRLATMDHCYHFLEIGGSLKNLYQGNIKINELNELLDPFINILSGYFPKSFRSEFFDAKGSHR